MSGIRRCLLLAALLGIGTAKEYTFARDCYLTGVPDTPLAPLDDVELQILKADIRTASNTCNIPGEHLVDVQPGIIYSKMLSGRSFEVHQGFQNSAAEPLTSEFCLSAFEKIVENCFEMGQNPLAQSGRALSLSTDFEFWIYNSTLVPIKSSIGLDDEIPTTTASVPGPTPTLAIGDYTFARDCNSPVNFDTSLPGLDSAGLQRVKADIGNACNISMSSLPHVQPGEILYSKQLSGITFEIYQNTADTRNLTSELCSVGFEKIMELCFRESSTPSTGRAISTNSGHEFWLYQSPPLEISNASPNYETPTIPATVPVTVPTLAIEEHMFARDCSIPGYEPAALPHLDDAALQKLKADIGTGGEACNIPVGSLARVQPGEILYSKQVSGMTFEVFQDTENAQNLTSELCSAGFQKIVELCFELNSAQGGLTISVNGGLQFRLRNSQLRPLESSTPIRRNHIPDIAAPVTVTVPVPAELPEGLRNATNTTQYAMDCGVDPNPWAGMEPSYMNERGAIDTVISRYCDGEGKVYGGGKDAFIRWYSGAGITYQLRLLNGAPPPGQAMCKNVWNGILTKCFGEGKGQGLVLTDKYEFKVFDMDLIGTDKEPFLRPEDVPTSVPVTTPTPTGLPDWITKLSPPKNDTNTTQYTTECSVGTNPWEGHGPEYMSERGAIDGVISRYCDGEGKVYGGGTDAFIRWYSAIGVTYQLRLLNGASPPGQEMCKEVWNGILTKCFGGGNNGGGLVLTDKYEFKVFDDDLIGLDKEPFFRPENVPARRSMTGKRAVRFGA
jgi:hypothetical protein